MPKLTAALAFAFLIPTTASLAQVPRPGQRVPYLEAAFANPPTTVRPYVWWHWMGPNFSKAGITKDLEAMKAMGVGGATIFNLTSAVQETQVPTTNNPWPTQTYRSPAYWDALRHAGAEAKRLGLELGLHNTPGYSTTGGPWIDETRGMKTVVWSKTTVRQGASAVTLPRPPLPVYTSWGTPKGGNKATLYWDLAVLATPLADSTRYTTPADFTAYFDRDGRLLRPLPAGDWRVYRLGYAPTMAVPHPVPDDLIGKCLEVDKISREQSEFHWNAVLNPLKEHLGPYLGTSFKHILIDSYEANDQNWTPNFRAEFQARKGYDPLPWLLTSLSAREKGEKGPGPLLRNSAEETARFAWDYRDVIAQLYFDNGWNIAKKKINEAGLLLQQEPYEGPFSEAQGGALADLPMGEFWTNDRIANGGTRVPAAASAAGHAVVGAEALTGFPTESKYTEDPEFLKPYAVRGFALGFNRLVLHHWVHQPFDDRYQPGMGMGWWGTHFSRFQTWAEPGKAFFTWLGRVQTLLQYGQRVADYVCLETLQGTGDLLSKNDFLSQDIRVVAGNLVLASGRTYRVLVLPDSKTMLPEVAEKVKSLVRQGATVAGPRPEKSPSLHNYPACDQAVATIGQQVWGPGTSHSYGQGYAFTQLQDALAQRAITPDYRVEKAPFADHLKVIHRRGPAGDVYFIANAGQPAQAARVSFRATGRQPELWQPEDGTMTDAPVWQPLPGRTAVELQLAANQVVFILFRRAAAGHDHLVHVEAGRGIFRFTRRAGGTFFLSADSAWQARLVYASGKTVAVTLPRPVTADLRTGWTIRLQPKLATPFTAPGDSLCNFSRQVDARLKYFAGTAIYTKTIQVASAQLKQGQRLRLNLGAVHDIASVKLNGKDLGVLWYPPYSLDITAAAKPGANTLEVAVTTNWANRLIGDEKEPADFEWGDDRGEYGRAMKGYPAWFLNNQPRPSQGRKAFTVWYYYCPDSPLQPAGLLGPVRMSYCLAKAL